MNLNVTNEASCHDHYLDILWVKNVCGQGAKAWTSSSLHIEITKASCLSEWHFFFSNSHCYMQGESLCAKAVRPLAKWWHRPSHGQPHGNPSVNSLERSWRKRGRCIDALKPRSNEYAECHTYPTHRCSVRRAGTLPSVKACNYVTFLCNPSALLLSSACCLSCWDCSHHICSMRRASAESV